MNHTLQTTFGGPLEAIYGTEITLPPLPKKRKLEEEEEEDGDDQDDESEVPDVVQGEIARLQRHFKVTLDPSAASGGAVSLICHMEDANLPSVPPISVTLPASYP